MVLFDIESAVLFTENAINASSNGFFIKTEFGKIAIESNPKGIECYDTITINAWECAPATRWALKHSHCNCDFHVIIEKGRRNFVTHARVVEALTRCMLMQIFKQDIPEDIVDAGIKVYMGDVDHHIPPINEIENEYAHTRLNMVVRNDSQVRELVRDIIERRIIAADKVLDIGRQLSDVNRNGWNPSMINDYEFGYKRDIMYVILYATEFLIRPMKIPTYINVIVTNMNIINRVISNNIVREELNMR